ncbi:MAG: S41 family peptidase [Defluviitaleaceae bacterium]|nr:S41 family peptidase [Defluviitaleaceae bacterium]
MKKRILLLGLVIFILASCGSRTNRDEASSTGEAYEIETAPSSEIEYTVAHLNEETEIEYSAEVITPTLQEVLQRANERREGIIKRDYSDILVMIEGHVPNPESILNFQTSPQARNISQEDAIADAMDFFQLMRDMYAGYFYFGGDEVFLPVRDAVLEELATLGAEFPAFRLGQILRVHLSGVIWDSNFGIDGHNLGRPLAYFIGSTPFDRTADGFRNRETGLYAVEVDGIPINEVMELSLSQSGEFYYNIVMLLESSYSLIMPTVTYSNGTSEELRLTRVQTQRRGVFPPSLEVINGVPVVTIRRMTHEGLLEAPFMDGIQLELTNTFMSFAEELKDEPVVIVDLRGNTGGAGLLSARWLHTFTGEFVPSNFVEFGVSEVRPELRPITPECTWSYVSAENIERYWPSILVGEGYFLTGHLPDRIIERDNLLIVLTDRYVWSAAEMFVDLSTNISNTLIIGTNTGGVVHFKGYQSGTMPRSGVRFNFASAAIVWPEGHCPERVGITPDIWVRGDALAATLAMLGELEG